MPRPIAQSRTRPTQDGGKRDAAARLGCLRLGDSKNTFRGYCQTVCLEIPRFEKSLND